MAGVTFERKSAARIAEATRRVERMSHGSPGKGSARGVPQDHVMFLLKDTMPAAPTSLEGVAVRAWILQPDIEESASWGDPLDEDAEYTPLAYVKGDRVEWIVNRSVDNEADPETFGIATRINGELTVVWIDCGPQ